MHPSMKRQDLIAAFFPAGIPRLWCPLLTHYRDDRSIDIGRMTAHLTHIVPWVKGYLIPGSTGDGWELDRDETKEVVAFALRMAREHDLSLLLGVLKTDTETMKRSIDDMLHLFRDHTGVADAVQCLTSARVSGFTVTPPKGASLDQQTIYGDLAAIAEKDVPVALYQLPQITDNEVAPATFETLVAQYENILLFKDSSGDDRIALSDIHKGDVYLVRGAEGDYARWLKDAGGPYDGFLLSTANCFPSQLATIIAHTEEGDLDGARDLSERLTHVIDEVFALVQDVPCGNVFTNANKAIDHYCAFGPAAPRRGEPMLHGGVRLSQDILLKTGEILDAHDFLPVKGYWE